MSTALTCTVELLSIGNELLLGNTVNTNASWVAEQVTELGGEVTRITTVGDNLEEISTAIREVLRRKPALLITTGGIGPTFDDMTLRALAKALRVGLRLNESAVSMIREHYARRFQKRRVPLTKPRLKMALIPDTGTPIRNPVGTAPGVRIRSGATDIFCLPGVPKEAKAIFRQTLSKVIRAKTGGMTFAEKWFKVKGVMESSLAPAIDKVMRTWRGVYIKSHPRGIEASGRPSIELHLSISSLNTRNARKLLQNASQDLARRLTALGGRVTHLS